MEVDSKEYTVPRRSEWVNQTEKLGNPVGWGKTKWYRKAKEWGGETDSYQGELEKKRTSPFLSPKKEAFGSVGQQGQSTPRTTSTGVRVFEGFYRNTAKGSTTVHVLNREHLNREGGQTRVKKQEELFTATWG